MFTSLDHVAVFPCKSVDLYIQMYWSFDFISQC